MPFRPSKWAIYAPIAVLPFLAALFIQGKALQGDIEGRVTANLAAAGAVWARPAVAGRDVKLSGDSPSAEQLDAAIAAVLGTEGVRLVESSVRIVEPPPAAPTIKPQSGVWGTFDIAGTWPEGNGNTLKIAIGDTAWMLGGDPAVTSDGTGSKLYNRALSIRRAQVVDNALATDGFGPSRLSVTGLGEQSPDVPDRTRNAHQMNRRVISTIVQYKQESGDE